MLEHQILQYLQQVVKVPVTLVDTSLGSEQERLSGGIEGQFVATGVISKLS